MVEVNSQALHLAHARQQPARATVRATQGHSPKGDRCPAEEGRGTSRPGPVEDEGMITYRNIIQCQMRPFKHSKAYFTLKGLSRKYLTDQQLRLPRHLASRLLMDGNLDALARFFGTDKNESHYYTQHYHYHFHPFRKRSFNLLEIGIGGYDNPWDGGHSLRMWKSYFPKATIYGLDIHDKSPHSEHRIKIYKGSQIDETLLHQVVKDSGGFDIIIDDGSHFNEHVIKTFQILFPLLNANGIYAIEDLQTSYWETDINQVSWGGSKDLDAPFTSVNFLKRLVDGLNYQEFSIDYYQPSYLDQTITALHFYHNLAFIYKGDNCEGSNRIVR